MRPARAGNVGHEQRCDGVAKTFHGTLRKLYVNGTNMPDVQSAIEAKLQADSSLDAVVTLGAPYADTAVKARDDAGSKAEIDTFDLNAKVAASLKNGTLGFAVDQQPYLQATRPSTCCGCTSTTATSSAAAARC